MCLRLYLNGDGMGKGSHLSVFFRHHAGIVRRATPLAFSSESDADASEPEPARARRRCVPPRPHEFLLQETYHRDEHCQRMSAVRVARRPRQCLKRLRQGRSAFSQGRCGLFGFGLTFSVGLAGLAERRPSAEQFTRYLFMPLILPYVHVVRGGQFIPVTGWNWRKQQNRTHDHGSIKSKSIIIQTLRSKTGWMR